MLIDSMEQVIENSYKNFHCKGLDYLCLERSDNLTVKAYFFNGDTSQLPEIVVPHNHRYGFNSIVLSGLVANKKYMEFPLASVWGQVYDKFDFYTPLNGGNGFEWVDEVKLATVSDVTYKAGQSYYSAASDIHTLQIHAPESVLILLQYEDEMSVEAPSQSYKLGNSREKPNLSGLYDKMTPDDVIKRLSIINQLGYKAELRTA